jgi:hypothetical protein
MTTTHAVLAHAARIVSRPEAFARGSLALNAAGLPTRTTAPDAACFCLVGSVLRACFELDVGDERPAVELLRRAAGADNRHHLYCLSDQLGHAWALLVLDRAIQDAETEAPPP